MAEEKRVVKGGFRATLALVISLVALALSIMAYNRTTTESELKAQIRDLQGKMEKMKQETSVMVDKVRQETAKTLEKLGQVMKKNSSR
ncbi:MAG: hypothetical protein JRH06_16715 [Deltaproteobacteria bacterium]|nr:hypothetical protein [Deltaproteobacteria bacterium]MBW2139179.1 hypothetical protein [Deltaproteobacteria bacterium]